MTVMLAMASSGPVRIGAVFYGGSECFQLVAIRREPTEPLPPANASSVDDEMVRRLRMVRAEDPQRTPCSDQCQ